MSDASARVEPRAPDPDARRAQAAKILSADEHVSRMGAASPAANALDSGGSSRFITRARATRLACVSGVASDRHARVGFALASAPVDVILCNQVYQYVSDVRPAGGFCTFGVRILYGVLAREHWLPLGANRAPAPAAGQVVGCDDSTGVLSAPRPAALWLRPPLPTYIRFLQKR